MKRRIQGAHPFRSSWRKGGLSGGVILTDFSGMSVAELRGLIDRRAYAVTSGRAAGDDYDTLVDKLMWLDQVLQYARTVQAAGRSVSGASATDWDAFVAAVRQGTSVSRATTAAIGNTATASSGRPPSTSSGSTSSTSSASASGKEWTDPGAPSGDVDTSKSSGGGSGFFSSPVALAGVVGVGVMLAAFVMGKK